MITLTEKEIRTLKKCFILGKGKAWEPPSGTKTEFFSRCVAAGFLEIVDGRCLFEVIKDSMVRWTVAGKIAIEALIERDTAQETISRALTGHFAGVCCHRTGGINNDPNCECREIAEVVIGALKEKRDAKSD